MDYMDEIAAELKELGSRSIQTNESERERKTEIVRDGTDGLTCPSCQFTESIKLDDTIEVENKSDIDEITPSLDNVISTSKQDDGKILLAFSEMGMEERSIVRTQLKSFDSVAEFEFVGDFECLIEMSLAEATCGHCGFSWRFNQKELNSQERLLEKTNSILESEVQSLEEKLQANQKIIEGMLSDDEETCENFRRLDESDLHDLILPLDDLSIKFETGNEISINEEN